MTSAHDLLTSGAKPLKLEYFDIEGVAEQVRIALSVANVPFDDIRIKFPDWATLKPTKKHGVLPEMILPDGTVVTDSMCMLRLAGEADKEGKLYPADITKRMKIEQVLGLVGDMSRAWSPGLYIGMRPQKFGYAPKEEWKEEEFNALVKKVRGAFVSEELPNCKFKELSFIVCFLCRFLFQELTLFCSSYRCQILHGISFRSGW